MINREKSVDSTIYIYIQIQCVLLSFRMSIPPYKHMWKWRDIRPSMVTHTLNLCFAYTHLSAHTQQWTHTRSSGQPFMLRCSGSSWGFGALLKGTSSWYWKWRERCTLTPPNRTRNLLIMSLTLTIRPWLPSSYSRRPMSMLDNPYIL